MGISQICDAIKALFKTVRPPVIPIPPIIMCCSLMKRPGLSPIMSAAAIIKSQSKFGAPTGSLPDGSQNKMNALIVNVVDEVYRALTQDAVVQVGISPGSIQVTSTGANAGGPIVTIGGNIGYGSASGAIT